MNSYRLTARLLSPLIVQQERQSNAPASLDHLPGSTLRGALAAAYLRHGGGPDDDAFQRLFVERPVCFPDLLPSHTAGEASRVLPLTAVSCKRRPGFLRQGGHGVKDRLAAAAAARDGATGPSSLFWECNENTDGRRCGSEIKPFTGFWNGDAASARLNRTSTLFQRHTGIDRQTGTVAQGVFYTTRAVADFHRPRDADEYLPQYMTGDLFLDDDQKTHLEALIKEAQVFAGADRSRGFGELEMTLHPLEKPEIGLTRWSGGFEERLREQGKEPLEPGSWFSVNLESPAILVDGFLRPSAEMSLPFPDVQPVLKIAKSHLVRGWQSSWGLPKPDDLAVAAGSVYLFRYLGEDLEGLQTSLEGLQWEGIGLRREEGFGRVSICEPLHIQEVT